MSTYYLRLSVTDRCNLRCTYCMPPDGVAPADRDTILSLEETLEAVRAIDRALPLRKIRLTGGEPLVRRGVADLVAMLAECLPGCELTMTTNGTRLAPVAAELRRAGLGRVNISLDTLDPERYRALTRGGEVGDAIRGLRAATAAGLGPVRLNSVLLRGINDAEVVGMVRFALSEGVHLRFLELMSIGPARSRHTTDFVAFDAALERLGQSFAVRPLRAEGTARWYEVDDGAVTTRVGFITPVSAPFCGTCDRLRLDARGRLFPCLMSEQYVALPRSCDGELSRWIVEALGRQLPQLKARRRGAAPRGSMSDIGG